jgi:hypothetical protein
MACQWYAVTGLTDVDADLIGRWSAERDSWNDLTTADTPEFLNSKAGEILSTSPQHTPSFFLHTLRGEARCTTHPGLGSWVFGL